MTENGGESLGVEQADEAIYGRYDLAWLKVQAIVLYQTLLLNLPGNKMIDNGFLEFRVGR